jgi:hypothetical protein
LRGITNTFGNRRPVTIRGGMLIVVPISVSLG